MATLADSDALSSTRSGGADTQPGGAESVARADEYCGTTYAAKLLGLSVATVQALVESGEIEAWKTRGGHRRISIASVNRYLALKTPQTGRADADGRRLRVLVVEDDPLMRELYTDHFDSWSLALDCTLLSSALDALIDMAHLHPDLLITDLMMPGVDGIEMLRVLKRNRALAEMQVLVVSAMAPDALAARGGLPEGALFLKKPLNFEWLHGYLSALLSCKRSA